METLTGVVTPYSQQAGGAASGTVIDHRSTTMHRFLSVIKTLVKNTPAFKTEETVLEALRDIEMFAKTFIDSKDVNRVKQETDPAPVEDVRLRRAPSGVLPTVVGPAIDYNLLAAALVRAQQEALNPPASSTGIVTDISSMPPAGQPTAQQAVEGQPEQPSGF